MLYNDIVIDGMIKRAAYQAAQETVYMMKRAAAQLDVSDPSTDMLLDIAQASLDGEKYLGVPSTEEVEDPDFDAASALVDRMGAENSESIDEDSIGRSLDTDVAEGVIGAYPGLPLQPAKKKKSGGKPVDPGMWAKVLQHLANNKFTYGGGAAGAGIGALLGDTPKSRLLYALLGGGGGAGLGALADHYLK